MKQVASIFMALVIVLGTGGLAFAESAAESVDSVQPIVEMVNINEADAETIAMALQRIGLKRAQDIVAWREANGKFTSIEQLLEIKGIGEVILESNRDRILL